MNRFVKYGAFFLAGFMSAGAMGMEVLFDFENTTGGWKATQWRAKVELPVGRLYTDRVLLRKALLSGEESLNHR